MDARTVKNCGDNEAVDFGSILWVGATGQTTQATIHQSNYEAASESSIF